MGSGGGPATAARSPESAVPAAPVFRPLAPAGAPTHGRAPAARDTPECARGGGRLGPALQGTPGPPGLRRRPPSALRARRARPRKNFPRRRPPAPPVRPRGPPTLALPGAPPAPGRPHHAFVPPPASRCPCAGSARPRGGGSPEPPAAPPAALLGLGRGSAGAPSAKARAGQVSPAGKAAQMSPPPRCEGGASGGGGGGGGGGPPLVGGGEKQEGGGGAGGGV